MATTLAHLTLTAVENNDTLSTFVDKATPEGHFGATTKVAGNTVVYLLEGNKDDPYALVKGHVVMIFDGEKLTANGYKGDSQTGKFNPFKIRSYMGQDESFESFFAKMV